MLRGIFQEIANPCSRSRSGAANTQPRADTLQIVCRVIIQFKVAFLSRNATPEINIWFVPNFEVPLRNLIDTISIDKMLREMSHQAIPPLHAFGRRHIWLVPEWMQRIWVKRKLLWHKANFNDRSHAVFQKPVVDLIHI